MTDIESISKITLGPDDVVVVRTNHKAPPDECLEWMGRITTKFPKNQVLFLSAADKLDVVSPEFVSKREFKAEDVRRWFGLDSPQEKAAFEELLEAHEALGRFVGDPEVAEIVARVRKLRAAREDQEKRDNAEKLKPDSGPHPSGKPTDSERWAKFMDGGWRTAEDGKQCNCTETRPGVMGTVESHDGKPMPSSVDRLKAGENDKPVPSMERVKAHEQRVLEDRLLEACEAYRDRVADSAWSAVADLVHELRSEKPELDKMVEAHNSIGRLVSAIEAMVRTKKVAKAVQQRRDELPLPMEGHR